MAKNIEPKLKKIGEYLKLEGDSKFLVPEYQRAYSWEEKQCDKLWQDIEDFIDSGGTDPYFFGTIIISCQEEDKNLSLIDGQQRTITFILLLKALLIRLNQSIEETKGDEDSQRLTRALEMKRDRIIKILYKAKDEDIYDILANFENVQTADILENLSINEQFSSDLKTILNSHDFKKAENEVKKIKYKQRNNKYTNYFRNFKFFYTKLLERSESNINVFSEYILDKSEIIEIRSWNVEQAITMFNSLNSDGMPLLDADIISAKLYSNSGDNREDFVEKWTELKGLVSDLEQRRIVDIDSILMQYMYIKRAIDREYISETGAVSVTTPGLRRYYTEENKELLKNSLGLTAQLLKIAKTWDIIKYYPTVQMSAKFNENIKLYLISYLYRYELDEITENLVVDFLHYLLKLFSVLELEDIGYSSAKFKTFLFGLNIKVVDKNTEIEEIKKDIKSHINKNWDKENIEKEILDYNKNPLVYLSEYIYSKKIDKKFKLPEKYEIEHIMPRSGKNIVQIRIDAGLSDEEEFLSVVNKLGNKMLLEEDINRSIGNAWFRTKIQSSVKEKKGYKDSMFLLAKNMIDTYRDSSEPVWTVEDINKRTEKISKEISDFIFS
ncbi:MAG TPA: DUF262 domain-containing HNH endonuclease family protein [Clostridia bacterium]|jgi:flagellar motility protein MotE (MotC chaperone)|nr:DUF262 domain-containing protein [Clostridiaceae bacterium]HOR90320.1 DUF262 domain-containing HNH endonuclease family protein [Clostridia bacterium]HQG00490.1 DUF262 domain-containing HNH endonuclease family protein [Clostridia bacterium]